MDHDLVDRIRSASFPLARKGYERQDVDHFLDELADWLEEGDHALSESGQVRRELERIGEQTTAILTEAHDAAETMREGAERQVRQQLADANIKAEKLRTTAEEYAEEVREEADSYARRVRAEAESAAQEAHAEAESAFETARTEAEEYAQRVRTEADEYAKRVRGEADEALAQAREKAERSAKQIVEEANRRRGEVEKVISDLEERRKGILEELRRLVSAAGIDEGPGEDETREIASEERTQQMSARPE